MTTTCKHFVFQECDNIWWDNLISEFFEDDAVLTIQFLLDDVPKKYCKYFEICLFQLKVKCIVWFFS